MYTLTPSGLKKIESYIEEIKAKRKEILDAGKDTASSSRIPTASEIFEDIVQEGFDSFDEARSEWAVTDHYSMEKAISLKLGEDVYEGNSIKKEKETEDLSWSPVSEEKRVAEYIKSNNLDIRWILEEMGYFQHILAGEDFVKSRLEALYECCDINIPYGIDREAFFKRVTDHVIKNNGFDAMNEKTESMEEADENLVDNAIEESAKAVQQEILNESRKEAKGKSTLTERKQKMDKNTPLGTEETMDYETAKQYLLDYSRSGSGIGEVITEEMMSDSGGYDAGKMIRNVFTACDTEEEWSLADRMFGALTGFYLKEITASTNHDPYSFVTLCGWHDNEKESFSSLEEKKDFYFKDRSTEELSELGAAALMAGGTSDADDVGYAYLSVFEAAKNDRQAQICDAVGIAVTGWSFDTLLDMSGCKHKRPDPEKKKSSEKSR